MSAWSDKFIGIPFLAHGRTLAGCDCYGLIAAVHLHELGIELPTYTDDYAEVLDRHQIAALIAREQRAWSRVEHPQPFDVVLMRAQGVAWHVGVVVEPGLMLHVLKGIDSCLERYDGLHWRERVVGFYRYRDSGLATRDSRLEDSAP